MTYSHLVNSQGKIFQLKKNLTNNLPSSTHQSSSPSSPGPEHSLNHLVMWETEKGLHINLLFTQNNKGETHIINTEVLKHNRFISSIGINSCKTTFKCVADGSTYGEILCERELNISSKNSL